METVRTSWLHQPWARCVLAIVGGLTWSLVYPPVGIGWLIFPAILMLLLALHGLESTRARTAGFLFGLAGFATGLSWLWNIFGAMSIVLWVVLAMFPALFAEMHWRAVRRGWKGWALAAFTAANWSAWEFVRAEIFPLKFPWMTVGLAIGPDPLLPWVGVYGVGLVAVFGIACLRFVRPVYLTGIPLVVFLASHAWIKPPAAAPPGTPVRMAAVQLEMVTLDAFLRETRALPEDIDWVVWPEYAVPYDVRRMPKDWKLITDLVAERGITLTFGTQVQEDNGWRNVAVTLDPTGELGEHTKVHTVHLFDDGTPGRDAGVFATAFGQAGTLICFDCDYEGVVRRMTAAGADFIVSPVMDAASWSARQHDQHAELFRIRACENRRWVFVAASSGISQVIDPWGRVRGRLGALEQGVLTGEIAAADDRTFYTRHGWRLPWAVLAVAVAMWLFLFSKTWRLQTAAAKH